MRSVVVLAVLLAAAVLVARSRLGGRGAVADDAAGEAAARRAAPAAEEEPSAVDPAAREPVGGGPDRAVFPGDAWRFEPTGPVARVAVRVLADGTGRPVPGVLVALDGGVRSRGLRGSERRLLVAGQAALTDAQGRAELFGDQAGSARVVVHGTDGECDLVEPASVDLVLGERHAVELRAPPASTVAVRVLDADTDGPMAGAELEAWYLDARGHLGARDTWLTRASDAEWRATVPPCARLRLRARADGRVEATTEVAHPATDVVIRLFRPNAVEVRALDPAGGPVPRVRVEVAGARTRAAVTDAGGRARIEGLPGGEPLAVRVRAPGGRPLLSAADVVLGSGETRAFEVTSAVPVAWRGRAVDEHGEPLEGLALQLAATDVAAPRYGRAQAGEHRVETHTRRGGAFVFDAVDPGLWLLGPARADAGVAVHAVPVAVPGDAGLTVVLHRDLRIRGRVTDAEGRPAPGVVVRARPTDRAGELTARAGSDGAFALGPLAPGPFEVWAEHGLRGAGQSVFVEAGVDDVLLVRP